MSELLLIVGNSGCGKDYICKNRFANYANIKLNQPFKDIFEVDHGLEPGTCNNKSKRNILLRTGPFSGDLLSQAMSKSYKQSLSLNGYGAKFNYITILATLDRIAEASKTRELIAITDLRKKTELEMLVSFAEVIHYETRMILVTSNKEMPMHSDESLSDNVTLYTRLTRKSVEITHNNY
jgi:hypothetical protein